MLKHNDSLTIKDTGKYGKGIFAAKNIKKGEVLHVLSGKRLDVVDVVKIVNAEKENIDDPFQIGRRTYLDLNNFSRLFNHSCDPTAGIRKNSELFALRDIKKGEQITFDYSLTIAPTEWEMSCKCGSSICRKIIGDIISVPKMRRDEYRKLGALQTYMKSLLKEVDAKTYKIPPYELTALASLIKTNN